MNQITVHTSRPYNILIGNGLLKDIGRYVKEVSGCHKVAVITDDIVAGLYLQTVTDSLRQADLQVCSYVFPNGEASKCHRTLLPIYDFLIREQLTRSDLIVALGGGVVGDLAGFAAATYLRGIDFVQVPTTFLAQIDSSVGGKTGVDTDGGKNLVGAFHQPILVLCDLDTLSTLPEENFKDGIGEAIKCGMIRDAKLFEVMRSGQVREHLPYVVSTCIDIKRKVVESDELDKGERMLLNFGHTVGHAIENYMHYQLTHGKCVGIGMAVITKAAAAAGIGDPSIHDAVVQALQNNGMPVSLDIDYSDACEACLHDKKRSSNILKCILIRSIGDGYIYAMPAENFKPFVLKRVEK